ncbi:MAG: RluA family pseudouridine synthase [Pseudomonadota bacterium]|nr:RluA family pseudouridine synthase [Pseudomonadota bacterium]
MAERLRWVATPGTGRLDRALADVFPTLSRARIQALIAEGRVTVDGEPAKASARPTVDQVVVIEVPDAVASTVVGEDIPLDVLFEDEDLIVLVKPAGMVVHPSAGHATGTLVNALLGRPGALSSIGGVERPGIVHRLDAGTSGVMVVARNDVTHRALSTLFAAHDLERRYLAVVHKVPLFDGGTYRSVLGRDPKDRLKISSIPEDVPEPEDFEPEVINYVEYDDEEDEPAPTPDRRRGRLAITHWRVRAKADRVSLVECRLETGRTHQVRVHLSEAGHPVVGDAAYGRRECVAPAAIRPMVDTLGHPLLHAWHLGFRHPRDGRALAFSAPPPADFVALCAAAGLTIPALELTPMTPPARTR